MTTKPTKKTAIKINDVAEPGTTIPSSSARPLMPHRSIVRDPMTVAPTTADERATNDVNTPESAPDVSAGAATHHTKLRIEPLNTVVVGKTDEETKETPSLEVVSEPLPAAPKTEPADDKPEESAETVQKPEVKPEPKSESKPKSDPEDELAADSEEIATEAEKAATKKDAASKALEAEIAYEAKLDTLIAEKKYVLPIKAARARKNWLSFLISLLIVLAIGGGLYAYFFVFQG